MINYKVIIKSPVTDKEIDDLKCYGFRYDNSEKAWVKPNVTSSDCFSTLKKYFKKHNLRYVLKDNDYERSTTYRKEFFEHHKDFHGHYFCAYCGRPYKKEKITVDHIFPIHTVRNSPFLKLLLKLFGIKNINDTKNLTPACKSCNSNKGTKYIGWITRGLLGKNEKLWIFRIALEFTFFFLLTYTISYLFVFKAFWFGGVLV